MKRGGNPPSAYKIWEIDWLQLELAGGTLAWGLAIVDCRVASVRLSASSAGPRRHQ
jgi:hypothetical protein